MQAVAKIFLGNLRTVAKKIDKAKEVQCVVSCLMMLEPKLLPGFTSYCLQDEPKCHGSLSRNSNNGVSLLLLWQVLHFLVNIEKQKHRRLQCLAFCGFLLKRKNPLWFFEVVSPGKRKSLDLEPHGRQQLSCGAPASLSIRDFNVRTRSQRPDLSNWLWQIVPLAQRPVMCSPLS